MKKFVTFCAVLALTACGEKKAAVPAVDSTAMMKPDTASMMKHDSGMQGMQKTDSTMARDTAKKM